jgi:hypothetical protein
LLSEDDTEELMKELERIKRERAEEAARKQVRLLHHDSDCLSSWPLHGNSPLTLSSRELRAQAEEEQAEQAEKSAEMAMGNPLVGGVSGSFNIKRRCVHSMLFAADLSRSVELGLDVYRVCME